MHTYMHRQRARAAAVAAVRRPRRGGDEGAVRRGHVELARRAPHQPRLHARHAVAQPRRVPARTRRGAYSRVHKRHALYTLIHQSPQMASRWRPSWSASGSASIAISSSSSCGQQAETASLSPSSTSTATLPTPPTQTRSGSARTATRTGSSLPRGSCAVALQASMTCPSPRASGASPGRATGAQTTFPGSATGSTKIRVYTNTCERWHAHAYVAFSEASASVVSAVASFSMPTAS